MTSRNSAFSKEARDEDKRDQPFGRQKRPYRQPHLEVVGDLRDITLSPSPGPFESGTGGGFLGA